MDTDEPVVIDHTDRAHGTYEDGTCDDCDWCARCGAVTLYDGERCTVCGRKWGES